MSKNKELIGKTIKIEYIDNGNSPINDNERYAGKTGKITSIDDLGQLWGTWGGIALIPGKDVFQILD